MSATIEFDDKRNESGNEQRKDARDGFSGESVKLVDVSWLVGNLYLDETDREQALQRKSRIRNIGGC